MKKRIRIAQDIEDSILKVLKNSENPISTRELALKVNRAWHSIDRHCLKLQINGKIKGFAISNINVWQIKK